MNDRSTTIEILRLKEDILKLKKQINFYRYDHLTGLKTRNDIEYDFNSLLDNEKNFSIHLCDINNLKYFNTRYGYVEGGDNLIKKVVDKLKMIFDHQYIYRIGGDEFLIFDFNLSEFIDDSGDISVVTEVIEVGSHMDIGTENEIPNLKKIISGMDKKIRVLKSRNDRRGKKQTALVKDNLSLTLEFDNFLPFYIKADSNSGEIKIEHSDDESVIYLKEKNDI
jgi:diguanylate cyclase (GGDEF)-like protein